MKRFWPLSVLNTNLIWLFCNVIILNESVVARVLQDVFYKLNNFLRQEANFYRGKLLRQEANFLGFELLLQRLTFFFHSFVLLIVPLDLMGE